MGTPEEATRPASTSLVALQTEYVFSARVQCDNEIEMGAGAYGRRRWIPIIGGSVEGPRLRGQVLASGADCQLIRSDGVVEIEARYTLHSEEGEVISVLNWGIVCPRTDESGAPSIPYVRTQLRFEAPTAGAHDWLNRSIFVGSLNLDSGPAPINVHVSVYRLC